MIKRFKETNCKTCGVKCKTGKRNLCNVHYAQRIKSRSKEIKPKVIPQRSAKESQRLAKYMKQREAEFKKDPICRVPGCQSEATEAHHPFGRIGNDLFIFKLICRPHHDQAEMNPNWAKDNGISFSRLNKRT